MHKMLNLNQSQHFPSNNFSYVCIDRFSCFVNCAQLQYTLENRSVLIIIA